MDALPTIFCPQCDRYVGHKLICSCGWARPQQPPTGHVHGLDVPIESPPLIVPGRGMVVFGIGARLDDTGGLIAIDLATGKPRWTFTERCAAVSGGAALAPDGEAVLFGDAAGNLHRVRLSDGATDWPAPRALGSLIEHAPVMPAQRTESSCVVGTSKGVIAWVDWRAKGNAVPHTHSIPDARISAPPVPLGGGRYLVVTLERKPGQRDWGGLYVVDPIQAPRRIVEAEVGIYAAPVLIDPGTVVVFDAKGQAYRVALNGGAKPSMPWKGEGIRSAPVLRGGVLYVAHGKRLTALRADTFRPVWSAPFECDHSLRAPAFVRGLLVCADTVGRVHALDALTGRPIWEAPFNAEVDKPAREIDSTHPGPVAAVLGGVAEHEGALWFGAGNGRIYSLPYWHTNTRWARDQAGREGSWRDAAALTLLPAKDAPLARLQAAEVEATEMLKSAQQHADAARIYRDQNPPQLRRAAENFEKAAATAAAPARMWAEAAACWLRIPELPKALRCQREAALARGSPWLEISDLSVSLKVGTVSILRFVVRNVGSGFARNPSISLLPGSDFGPCHPDGRAELGDEDWSAELRGIAPMQAGELMMSLNAAWEDDAGNESRQQFKHRVIAAEATQPATVIHIERLISGTNIEGDLGLLKTAKP
jgi:outer membrane protein assembly factor BamB